MNTLGAQLISKIYTFSDKSNKFEEAFVYQDQFSSQESLFVSAIPRSGETCITSDKRKKHSHVN